MLNQNLALVHEGAEKISRKLPDPFPTTTITAVILLEENEAINSERVIDEAGPWAVAALHFIWELYQQSSSEEVAPLRRVHWFNHKRLLEPIGDIPPVEKENLYYHQLQGLADAA